MMTICRGRAIRLRNLLKAMVWCKAMIHFICMQTCLLVMFMLPVRGQWVADTLSQPDTTATLEASTTRLGINTFAGRAMLNTGKLRWSKQELKLLNWQEYIYNTAAVPENRFVTADWLTSMQYAYSILPSLKAIAYAHRLDYGATRNRSEWAGAGLYWQPKIGLGQELHVKGAGEWLSDKRNTITDQGPGYELAGHYSLQTDSGLSMQAGGRVWEANINPRRHQAWHAYASAMQTFGPDALLMASVGYRGRRIEDYTASGSGMEIQSIWSDTAMATLRMNYAVSEGWTFRSANTLTIPNRSFDYRGFSGPSNRQNTFYTQLDWDLRQTLTFQNNWFSAEERFEYIARDRAYGVRNNLGVPQTELDRVLAQERIKDITEVSQAWYTTLRFVPGDRHRITLNSVAQLLRVDTRSPENNQDRDEVLYSGEASWRYVFSRTFRTDFKLSGSYRHIVYITAEQSSENFKERIARLEPSFAWTPGRFSWTGSYQLFVTYHVRDFNAEQGRNRSNRILLMTHQLRYRLPKAYDVQLDVLRRENRLGQLSWERFSESPIDTVVIWDVALKGSKLLGQSGKTQWRLGGGYRMFRQSRTSATGLNEGGGALLTFVNNIVLQHGPTITLASENNAGFTLSTDFWLQYTSIYNDYRVGTQPFTGPSQTREQLDMVQQNFFPNFTVNLVWNLRGMRRWLQGQG